MLWGVCDSTEGRTGKVYVQIWTKERKGVMIVGTQLVDIVGRCKYFLLNKFTSAMPPSSRSRETIIILHCSYPPTLTDIWVDKPTVWPYSFGVVAVTIGEAMP